MDDPFLTGVAIIALGVLIAIVFIIVRLGKTTPSEPEAAPLICTACGQIGHPRHVSPGSPLVEILLWLFAIIPGVFYSMWRRGLEHNVCPSCGSREMIPLNTPRASELLARYHQPKVSG